MGTRKTFADSIGLLKKAQGSRLFVQKIQKFCMGTKGSVHIQLYAGYVATLVLGHDEAKEDRPANSA